jgi:serine/threonine-protein kinase
VVNGYFGGQGLFWQRLDGGAVEPLLVRENMQYAGTWSPNGSVFAFVEVAPETKRDIWLVSMDEEGETRPALNTRFEEYAPAFSPDGRFIAYVSDQSGRPEVYVRDYPGKTKRWQVSTAGGGEPVWARDGRELFYRNREEMMVVDVRSGSEFVAGLPRALFSAPYITSTSVTGVIRTGLPNYDVSPDGEHFVMVASGSSRDRVGGREYRVVLNWFEELERLVPINH